MKVTVSIELENSPVYAQSHSYSVSFGPMGDQPRPTRREFLDAVGIAVDQIAVEGPDRGWFRE